VLLAITFSQFETLALAPATKTVMAIRPVFGWQLVIWEVGKIA
jgi:hypothetical protein